MKTTLLFVLTTLLSLASPAAAKPGFEDKLKSHLDKLTKENLPGVAVLAARDGKVVFQGGFGFADLEKKTPVTVDTKFRIGSITKQFTAAGILKLAEDGKLSLDDKLEKFFPGFPGGTEITVHQILTHTSGLHSYTGKPEFMSRVGKAIEPAELIKWFRDDKPDFKPGQGFLYNNSAYFLAGEIAAKVSGKSLDAFWQETFFAPLGMKNTGVYVNAKPPEGVARGYSMTEGKPAPAVDWDMSWAGGAGALYSTVGDLFLWNEALYGGKVLKPESFKKMITPVKLPPGVDGMNYGYGLMMATVSRLPSINHSGGLHGWSSDMLRLPEQHCTVVALTNAMPGVTASEPGVVTRRIATEMLSEEIAKLPPRQEFAGVDKKTYSDFAGRYSYQAAVLTVTVADGHLFAQLTGQPKYEIHPSAKDSFFWKVTDADVTFERNEKGEVVAAQHSQGGNFFRAPRVVEPAVKLTAAELDAVMGKYNYGPGGVMTVTRDGGSVFAQLTGQPAFEIFPTSATEFEWRVTKASVKFVKNSDGKVTKAVHSQGGVTFDAPKME